MCIWLLLMAIRWQLVSFISRHDHWWKLCCRGLLMHVLVGVLFLSAAPQDFAQKFFAPVLLPLPFGCGAEAGDPRCSLYA